MATLSSSPSMFLANELSSDTLIPSFFDLEMQERLQLAIRPGLKYIHDVLGEDSAQYAISWTSRYYDEVFCMLMFVFERYNLVHYDGLASERLLGIKRMEYIVEKNKLLPLSARSRMLSLAFAVGMPYIKEKLDQMYKRAVDRPQEVDLNVEEDRNDTKWIKFLKRMALFRGWNRFKRSVQAIYPTFHFVFEAYFLVYKWLYLLGESEYFTPVLKKLKLVLVKVTANDVSNPGSMTQERTRILERVAGGNGAFSMMKRMLLKASWFGWDNLHVLAFMGLLSYRFLFWVYNNDTELEQATPFLHDSNVQVPPPQPYQSADAKEADAFGKKHNKCPLCRKQRTNPAACASGFVFCYRCIHLHISQHERCPVTNIKCSLKSIRRLFDENTARTKVEV